jgi:large subunit ribosomal protein L10
MLKTDKEKVINRIKDSLDNADSVFVTEYTGLNVEQITKLRKDLRDNSVRYLVAKNTLMRLAVKDTRYEGISDYLIGQTAIALGVDDPAVPAKILYDSFKSIEKPVIRAFVLEGQIFTGDEITRLAELPTRDVLYSMVVAAVESPMVNLVGGIDAVFQELIATLEALEKSK